VQKVTGTLSSSLGVPPFRPVGIYAAFDEKAIWGTGDTPMAARLDARRWLRSTTVNVARETGNLQTALMTERLRREVEVSGGNVAYFLGGNMLDLWSDE
jgi:hypothetical protein